AIHPQSLNTVRVVTFRWEGRITVLLAFARFGTGGRANDNVGTGGACCGIDLEGNLLDCAVDAVGRWHQTHPSTGFDFIARHRIPGYRRLCERAVELHHQMQHFVLISWDLAVGPDEEPIFIEANYRGAVHI